MSEQENLIKELIMSVGLSRLESFSALDEEFRILETDPDELKVLDYWTSLILISGKQLRILYKVHFNTDFAKILAEKNYGKAKAEISDDQAKDFIRELCNLTAGRIKHVLQESNINVGISLPLVTRGFDELFFVANKKTNEESMRWSFKASKEVQLKCSAVYEVYDQDGIANLKLPEVDNADDEGDVEFL